MTIQERASRVRLLLFDVDGVLTDGAIIIHGDGSESKGFHIRDGAAIVWAQRAGLPVGLLSARTSAATTARAAQLAVRYVQQGTPTKSDGFEQILRDASVEAEAVAYMGDDLLDLPVLRRSGLAAAPADAAAEVREAAHWVSPSPGGHGAARELIELVLKSQGRWNAIVAEYAGDA